MTWAKTNPPPNISCRYFTHSTEFIIWARKSAKITHYYNYSIMKQINSNKQMTDVWQLPAIARWEKSCGKHPTQKPLSVLSRIILASTRGGAWILDPFTGSSTTGIAANLLGRRFLGIDREEEYLILSKNRKKEIEQIACYNSTSIECVSKSNLNLAINEKLFKSEKATVVWNGSSGGVDLKRFDYNKREIWRNTLRSELGYCDSDFIYGFIGRITGDKGINELLACFFFIKR